MKIFGNPPHAQHVGRQAMFRGRMVDNHEEPARWVHVPDELAHKPLGCLHEPPSGPEVDAAIAWVYTADDLAVGQTLSRLQLSTALTFEGGYDVAEMGVNAVNVLKGWQREGLRLLAARS